MLRVNVEWQGNRYRLVLHGVLGAEWVPLVEQQWRAIRDRAPLAAVTLVMSDVEFIDAEGERLLRRMAEGGVDFIVSGCLNRHVIEKVQRQARATKGATS
jgi:hypothetical protein